MTFIKNLVEYYDELYPVSGPMKKFYAKFMEQYPAPPKFLHVASGTGSFEFELARLGGDVTGIEVFQPLLTSANLKRRNQMLSVRFFKLSTLEMGRFLGQKFYNVISCLHNRLAFIHDVERMKNFFSDCRALMTDGGTLVLQLYNYKNIKSGLADWIPPKTSIRAALYTAVGQARDGSAFINQELETGNGRIIPILQNESIYPVTAEELAGFAKKAGFSECAFYSDFEGAAFRENAPELICVVS